MHVSNVEPTVAAAGRILDRILVPIDYSMDSHLALGVALELQRTHGSTVRLFHAAESDGSDDWLGGIGSPAVGGDWVAKAKGRLRRFLENVAPGNAANVEVSARVGETLHTLLAEIREWRPSLLVAAATVDARVFRSAAQRIVRDAAIPTLIIPAAAK